MISKNYDDEDLNLNHIFSSKLSPRSKKVWSHNSGISADGFEDKHKLLSIIPYLTPPPAPPWIPSSSSQTSEIGLWMSFLSAFKFAVWSQGVLIKPSSSVRPTGIRPYCAEIQYSPYQLLINWHLCSFHSSKYRNVAHQVTSFDFSCNACHNRQESQWNRMDEEKQTSKRLSDMYSIW